MKKVLILGSGALKIGEAGEFDYSGSQAIKALKEEGIKTVLVNPNIATYQTSEFLADKIYFLPVADYFVEQVIKKERPDGILLSFGGQTALNCGISLYQKKILEKHNVTILGTPMKAIILTEDREKFAKHIQQINLPIPKSQAVTSIKEAINIVGHIDFPVMIRAAYCLGGQKSGVARNLRELRRIASEALAVSPQILIEKYLHHFKELEYEVVRDAYDNCITICNMENLDPMGIHTGDSIVIAPSQTLTNFEYHSLRKAAIQIVRSLGIVGECNVQFALASQPKHKEIEFYIIEVNARLSRSSALASKATGYPLAYVAAKLALGKKLTDITNNVTKITQACFEPSLDYVVVKIPRWDLEKFEGVEEKIGSSMKSVGEVMAIGRTFEETLQKAVRMLDINVEGVTENNFYKKEKELLYYITTPTPIRIFKIAEAIKHGISIDEIYRLSGIDRWFLYRIENIIRVEKQIAGQKKLTEELLIETKRLGFSDKKIANLLGKKEMFIRKLRKKWNITPSVFQIDTLAGEFPAKTNYLYTTYSACHHDVKPLGKKGVVVLGSGPYRIGSSVEFDWTCVNAARALKKYNKKSIIINCNPETVSTDYDITDRLYFDELTFERVMDILEYEKSFGTMLSVGGQTPNNLAKKLAKQKIHILGTRAKDIDRAEDRSKFSKLLDKLGINQPVWSKFADVTSLIQFSRTVGYPVLLRPSYVLSGSAMSICNNEDELKKFISKAAFFSNDFSITVSKFISSAKEIEFDSVAQKGQIKVMAISEHIEHAGVHSGDATIIYPAQTVYLQTEKQIITIAVKIAKALNITGPFNIQFLAKENQVLVIEANIRASRTFPFISKATNVNFAEVIVDSVFSKSKTYHLHYPNYAVVKAPQFSFARLEGVDPILHVEMASTGEVACFGDNAEEAYLKSLYSTSLNLHKKSILLSIGGIVNKERMLDSIWRLKKLGFYLWATEKTFHFLKQNLIKTKFIYKVFDNKKPNTVDLIKSKKIGLVININDSLKEDKGELENRITDGYLIRRAAVDNNIPLFTDLNSADFFIKALTKYKIEDLKIKEKKEYL